MTDLRQAAQMALEALESRGSTRELHHHVITTLRAAIRQQAEPILTHRITSWGHCGVCRHDRIPGEGCARQECPDSPQQQAEPVQKPKYMAQSNGRHSPLLTHMMNKRTALAEPEQSFEDEQRVINADNHRRANALEEAIHAAWSAGYVEGEKATLEQQAELVAWIFTPNNELLWPHEVEATNPIELNSYQPLYTRRSHED